MLGTKATRLFALMGALLIIVALAAAACAESATPTPRVVEVEATRIVEVTPVPAPKETIVFSDLNWTSAQVQNRIAQFIVEHGYGYPTDTILGANPAELPGTTEGRHPRNPRNLAAQPEHRLGKSR